MKRFALLSLVLSSLSFAMPIASSDAIQGLFSTPAFQQAEPKAQSALQSYDAFAVEVATRTDGKMMAACHPDGSLSKSGTNLKVTYVNRWNHKSVVQYFSTDERAEDFQFCGN